MSARLVSVDDLVTVDGIAKRLKISVNAASNIVRGRESRHRKKIKFPRPLVGKGAHGVWLWSDVEEWLSLTPRNQVDIERLSGAKTLPYRQPSWAQSSKSQRTF